MVVIVFQDVIDTDTVTDTTICRYDMKSAFDSFDRNAIWNGL